MSDAYCRPTRLSARIEKTTPAHAYIGVFQNGGKAGVLCVDLKVARQVTNYINSFQPENPPQSDLFDKQTSESEEL